MVQATKDFGEAVAAASGAEWTGASKTQELCMDLHMHLDKLRESTDTQFVQQLNGYISTFSEHKVSALVG